MKKSSWKLILIIVAGILAVVMLGVFGVQSSQNKAFSLEEQVNTADSDIKVQEKRRVDLVYKFIDFFFVTLYTVFHKNIWKEGLAWIKIYIIRI